MLLRVLLHHELAPLLPKNSAAGLLVVQSLSYHSKSITSPYVRVHQGYPRARVLLVRYHDALLEVHLV